jgi:hypothetical protein
MTTSDAKRMLVDDTTDDLLFMRWRSDLLQGAGWAPDIDAMEAWRRGELRLYRPEDELFITMPGHECWPVLTSAERAEIRAELSRPWIPDGHAMEGVPEDEIDTFDAAYVAMMGEDAGMPEVPSALADLLDTVLRPVLVMEPVVYSLVEPAPRPSAPSYADLMGVAVLASLASASAPPQQAPPPPPMPRHVAELVIAKAEADGATCAITMEPIRAATAAVTSCGHVFQAEALRTWLESRGTCPECRQPSAAAAVPSAAVPSAAVPSAAVPSAAVPSAAVPSAAPAPSDNKNRAFQ